MVDARDAHAGRRHDPLRRGQPGPAVERLRRARPGRGRRRATAPRDANPMPSFTSPHANEATVRVPAARRTAARSPNAQLFVGSLRGAGGADGRHRRGHAAGRHGQPGAGHVRVRGPGHRAAGTCAIGPVDAQGRTDPAPAGARCRPTSPRRRPARRATGDGINLDRLIDDDEVTNWASLDSAVAGKQVTVDLAGGTQLVEPGQRQRDAAPADPDRSPTRRRRAGSRRCASSGSRRARRTAGVTCTDPADFRAVFTSAPDAFPSVRAAATGAGADHRARSTSTDAGHAPAHRGADQPVHRRPGLRR